MNDCVALTPPLEDAPDLADAMASQPTPAQLKAARALLGWSGEALAKAASVSLVTVRRCERDDADPKALAYRAIVRTIEDSGIEFTEDGGVRPRK